MDFSKLQLSLERAELLSSVTISATLIELHRVDNRGWKDQAEINYWEERLNSLCQAIELENKYE